MNKCRICKSELDHIGVPSSDNKEKWYFLQCPNGCDQDVPGDQEIKAWATALYYCKKLDDCCPDVGMGIWLTDLLDDVLKKADVILSDEDRADIISYYEENFA